MATIGNILGGVGQGLGQGTQLGMRLQAMRQQSQRQQQAQFAQGVQTLANLNRIPKPFRSRVIQEINQQSFGGAFDEDTIKRFAQLNDEDSQMIGELMQEALPGFTPQQFQAAARQMGGVTPAFQFLAKFADRKAAQQAQQQQREDLQALSAVGRPPTAVAQAPAASAPIGENLAATVRPPQAAAPTQPAMPQRIRQLQEQLLFLTQDPEGIRLAAQRPELVPNIRTAFQALSRQSQPTVSETQLALRAEQGDEQAIGALRRLRAQRRSGATTVNVGPDGQQFGKPPQGTVWGRDSEGNVMVERDPGTGAFRPIAVPIRGSKAFREATKAETGKKLTQKQAQNTANIVTDEVNRVLGMTQESILPTTGLAGSFLSNIPGTAARDIRGLLDTIRANVGFDKLQQMRAASPTGGALGQVSERENLLLQSTLGNLEQSQSRPQFIQNLKRLHNVILDTVHGEGQGPQRYRLAPAPSPGQIEQREQPPSGTPMLPPGVQNAPVGKTLTLPSGVKITREK